ncbi:cation channel family protein (macronuclear) [Tetrahymena thermophila SB210]|uniref:Cation channel family protein n=1 Tax=Tetrahymena thermophila (strain SB210) TaxID=312017 RepID=W7X8D5_TETTS|nr:cation channel family protein [Tetrahymena thermophila SB210]EWS73607.1 cation channel family protein [Tetrahymena thermophila SB210]|eukprot:XP_012653837.1 cation channel family protein [Tetrahymena thermophila SB210]
MDNSISSFVLSNSICTQVEQPFTKIKQTSELDQLKGDNDSIIAGSFAKNSSYLHKESLNNCLVNMSTLQQQCSLTKIVQSERIIEQGIQISSLADHIIQQKEMKQFDNNILENQSAAEDDEFEIQEDKYDQTF